MASVDIPPVQSLSGIVVLPGSKSMTNRIVLLAALSEGISGIENVLVSQCPDSTEEVQFPCFWNKHVRMHAAYSCQMQPAK